MSTRDPPGEALTCAVSGVPPSTSESSQKRGLCCISHLFELLISTLPGEHSLCSHITVLMFY